MNPYKVVQMFEKSVAEYSGAKYAVAVESCCAALFLSCLYVKKEFKLNLKTNEVGIPTHTYPGVACSIINAGYKVSFRNEKWSGGYWLHPLLIYDGALRFKRNMYKYGFHCLSFHAKKHLPIGRGGMILCNDKKADNWFRQMRFDGRHGVPLLKDKISLVGWNMYMTSEQAARGLVLFDFIKNKDLPDLDANKQGYPDLSKIKAYQ
jgi:dTDP-4-amino-4,6-dideoxygalactose transaminase